MPFTVDDKLVIAVASSALFDLRQSDRVYRMRGREIYEKYQRKHEERPLAPGVAFPFIRRLLKLNPAGIPENNRWVEVILLSRNSANTGLRVMNSIKHHRLSISRAVFTTGRNPYPYLGSFGASLFLSADAESVQGAIRAGYPAGQVLHTEYNDDPKDRELRIAFDFDGVLAGDEAERIFKLKGIDAFHKHEQRKSHRALQPGPLHELLMKLGKIQNRNRENVQRGIDIRTAIITARSAPAHRRLIETMRSWGLEVDEALFLGGLEKSRCLRVFRPHIFFDDQQKHLSTVAPGVHIPFGVGND